MYAGIFVSSTRVGPFLYDAGGVGSFGETRRGDVAEVEKSRDRIVRLQAERLLDVRVVGWRAGAPEPAQAEGVGGDQHVLRCGTGRDHLLDGGNLRVLLRRGGDHYEERCTQRLLPLGLEHAFGCCGFALAQSFGKHISEPQPRVAAHHQELPWSQPAVVGGAQAGVEDLAQGGFVGSRIAQPNWRDPSDQGGEGVHQASATASSTAVSLKNSGFIEVYISAALLKTNLRKSSALSIPCSTSS